jgi:hypothetical protein
VPQRQLNHAFKDFQRTIEECRRLAEDAYRWSTQGSHPHISKKRRDSMTELAFLRAYLAWEVFLEETFVLYLLGMRAPRGRAPRRYTFPPNRRAAEQWVIPEGRPFAKWDAVAVATRAERFFYGGGTFTPALRSHQSALDDMKTIRNAVAHESQNAREKFEAFVRVKLAALPPNLTVGAFLLTTVPGSTPTTSFLDLYLDKLELVASLIVPT